MKTSASPRLLYWDSCVFLNYFEKAPNYIDILDQVWGELEANTGSMIFTSQITTVEVSYIAEETNRRQLDPQVISALDSLWWAHPLVQTVEVNRAVTEIARDLLRHNVLNKWGLKAGDAIQLATAQWLKQIRGVQEFHTYDIARLRKYKQFISMDIIEPYVKQPSLGLGNT